MSDGTQGDSIEALHAEIRVALREHIDAIFAEKDRYIERTLAEADRRTERAAIEREQAALALRIGLERAINEGDANLREHVKAQFAQVQAALVSADLLERERIALVMAMVNANTERVTVQAASQKEAILKAENATDKRLEGMNEFRAQLSDQNATSLPRETFEAEIKGWDQWRQTVDQRLNQTHGTEIAVRRQQDLTQPWQIWAAGTIIIFAVIAVNVIIKLAGG